MPEQPTAAAVSVQPPREPLLFSAIHGTGVILNSERRKATRCASDPANGYVFSARPIIVGAESFRIKLLNVTTSSRLSFGVTSCNPSELQPSQLPIATDKLLDRPEYWVVVSDFLSDLEYSDTIAFFITAAGEHFKPISGEALYV